MVIFDIFQIKIELYVLKLEFVLITSYEKLELLLHKSHKRITNYKKCQCSLFSSKLVKII